MYKKYTQGFGMPVGLYRKIWLIMRLTTIILLITLIQVSAATKAQQVTLKTDNASLKSILAEIKKQTGYMVLYPSSLVNKAKPVIVNLNNAPLKDALDKILTGQGLEFEIQDKSIVIREKNNSLIMKTFLNIDIQGRVLDENGKGLAGVTIKVKDSNKATISGNNGEFHLSQLDPNAILIFSFIGYNTIEFPVSSDLSSVKMPLSSSKLDEVQIIAYGQTTQRLSTGNVTTIKASDIEKQPVNNPLLTLQGRVPGLVITQATGMPGSGVSVRIQGQNSIDNGNDPLYIVDGVPYASQTISTVAAGGLGTILGVSGSLGSGAPAGGSGNPLSYINPNDIESISILKDADATAIYGSRAANGAILITTKKGKAGPTKVNFRIQQGVGNVTRKLQLLNTQQYVAMRKEAKKNDNSGILATDYDINGTWDTTRYTDWQKTMYGQSSHLTNVYGTVSGGNDFVQYLIGGTFSRETAVIPGDFSDRKISVHNSINGASKNKLFKFQFSSSYQSDVNKLPGADPLGAAIFLPPDAPALYNSDGTLNWAQNSSGTSTWVNPLATILKRYRNISNNLISNLSMGYQLTKCIEFKSSFGYNLLSTDEFYGVPATSFAPEKRLTTTRKASYSQSKIHLWIVEPQFLFNKTTNFGAFNVLFGTTFQQNSTQGLLMSGEGYNNDGVLEDILSATTTYVGGSNQTTYKYNALFGRFGYNLDDKYLLNLSARRDGSSRFGFDNRFNNFASIGLAWIFTNEKSFKLTDLLSFGKLRVNYGTTGSDQIGDYTYLSRYQPYPTAVKYQNVTSLVPVGLSNPGLQWESTKKFEAGLDFGFFKDRVALNLNYVRNRSGNQLISYQLPLVVGYDNITRNFNAVVQNTAWEFSLFSQNIVQPDFKWSTGFNLTIPKNKLVDFNGLANSTYASRLIIGEPLSIQKVYHYIGVNPETGLYEFMGSDGKPTSNPNYETDRSILVNPSPKYYGGLTNTISYKGFQLDFLLQFVKQIGFDSFYAGNNFSPGYKLKNQPIGVLNRWREKGDSSPVQQFVSTGVGLDTYNSLQVLSDAGYSTNTSFIRLKNVSLTYLLPSKKIAKYGISNARLFLNAQNLLTFTKFGGIDPESQSIGSLPPLRVITGGLEIGF